MTSNIGLKHLLAAILSASLLFSASPGQWAVAPVMWVALVPLLLTCHSNKISTIQAAKLGFICGFLYNIGLLYWIVIALGRYGGLTLPVSILALVGLAAYMALYFAGFTLIVSATNRLLPMVISAPIIWVGFDQIKAWLFTGFPWMDLGYSQFEVVTLIQIADITGHSGLTFLIVMVNAFIATLLLGTRQTSLLNQKVPFQGLSMLLACLLIAGTVTYGKTRLGQLEKTIAQAPTLSASVIQGNIDQNDKWSSGNQQKTVETYLQLTKQAADTQATDLAIWPETALPFFPMENALLEKIQDYAALPSSPEIFTGAPHYSVIPPQTVHYFNSAFLVTASRASTLQRYDKQHLVPFGEYVPFENILGMLPIAHTMGNFSRGQSATPIKSKTAKLGVLICFESIFPSLARKRTDAGAGILVNLTNDAWYGKSSAPYQQVPMAVLRAVENRRSLARSANTGISCFIDPLGQILAKSAIFEKTFLVKDLPIINEHSLFNRFGYAFDPGCLLLLSLIVLYGIVKSYTYGPKRYRI